MSVHANSDRPVSSSLRTKTEHLGEIDRAHTRVLQVLQIVVYTRRNVPMGSYIHARLTRTEKELSAVLRDLKANSSRWMREGNPKFAWQEGFGAFSVSPSQTPTVKQYIRTQAEHHKKRNFEEEFLLRLKKSGVDYGPRYVFG